MKSLEKVNVFSGLSGLILAALALVYTVLSWNASRTANTLPRTANDQAILANRIALATFCLSYNEVRIFRVYWIRDHCLTSL